MLTHQIRLIRNVKSPYLGYIESPLWRKNELRILHRRTGGSAYLKLGVTMSHFTDREIEKLSFLAFGPNAQPYFDPLRYCLRWPDEDPVNYHGESYERSLDLVLVRSFIHLWMDREKWWALCPTTYSADVWDEAFSKAPNWPRFKRLRLNATDRAYLENERAKNRSRITSSE